MNEKTHDRSLASLPFFLLSSFLVLSPFPPSSRTHAPRLHRAQRQPAAPPCLFCRMPPSAPPPPGAVVLRVPPERYVATPFWELVEHARGAGEREERGGGGGGGFLSFGTRGPHAGGRRRAPRHALPPSPHQRPASARAHVQRPDGGRARAGMGGAAAHSHKDHPTRPPFPLSLSQPPSAPAPTPPSSTASPPPSRPRPTTTFWRWPSERGERERWDGLEKSIP